MLCKVYCACCNGLEVTTVTVEVSVTDGIQFYLVGLPDSAVKESQQRIESALHCYGFRIPGKRITINLAPANIRKEGSSFDVPIAIGILCASAQLDEQVTGRLEEFIILGELSLDGKLRDIPGALPIIIHAKEQGFKACILPPSSAMEGAEIEGITVYSASTFKDVLEILMSAEECEDMIITSQSIRQEKSVQDEDLQNYDFAQVRGQKQAKRGLEIAAAGGHNIMLNGSPGSGKTFMAKCLRGILPPMSKEEAIQTSNIYSVAGLLAAESSREHHSGGLLRNRPFRSPHHSITPQALIGGGNKGLPGEISLAHNGVLFLDEFAEFDRRCLEVLRQPLEDGIVQISRVKGKHFYPARFMLVAAMNPCPCGNLYEEGGKCKCSSSAMMKYRGRISGPLLDRIDIQLIIRSVRSGDLVFSSGGNEEPSRVIAERVRKARLIQMERYAAAGESFFTNAAITPSKLSVYCRLSSMDEWLVETFVNRHGVSARGYTRILKIARTVADLDGSQKITTAHLSEAFNLRCPDKNEILL
ncbi:MAG: YifB family Mg chelatase-like AAA ATPase [Bacteroidales bacterium]|nr:YifB family Mg chelatase-like AAA ATPase [Bacteroidales bacterium]